MTFEANTRHGKPTSHEERLAQAVWLVEDSGLRGLAASPETAQPRLLGNAATRAESDSGSESAAIEEQWQHCQQLRAGYLLGIAAGSRRGYAGPLRDLFGYAAAVGCPPSRLGRPALQGYLHGLSVTRSLSPATVGRHAAAIAGWYRYLLDEGVLEADPMRHVRRPRVAGNAPSFTLSRQHLQALVTEGRRHSPRAYALIITLATTGARIGEILATQAPDLGEELGHPVVRVRRKGGAVQALVLADPVAGALHRYLDGRTTGALFTTRTGRAWDRTGASRLLHRLADRALSPAVAERFHPHAIRVAAIGLALAAGVEPLLVMRRAGHRSFSTTLRYAVRYRELTGEATPTLVDPQLILPPPAGSPSLD